MFPQTAFERPAIRIPIPLNRCSFCNKKGKLLLCSSCLDVGYCNPHCQKEDWKQHKAYCKKHGVDKIDMGAWYPMLAWICFRSHHDKDEKFKHPALERKVLNSMDEQQKTIGRISSVRTLDLGSPCQSVSNVMWETGEDNDALVKAWWPRAPSSEEAYRLVSKIKTEKGALLGLISAAFGLLTSMYLDSPLAVSENGRSPRMMMGKYPITDFGISRGRLFRGKTDRLQYRLKPENELISFQDPNIHYWIYFTNSAGESGVLDCNCIQYGIGIKVDCSTYNIVRDDGTPHQWYGPAYCPGWFLDASVAPSPSSAGYHEDQRTSVLHDPGLQDAAVAMSSFLTLSEKTMLNNAATAASFMDRVSVQPVETWEKELLRHSMARAVTLFWDSRRTNNYLRFPKHPSIVADWGVMFSQDGLDKGPSQDSEEYKQWCKDRKKFLQHLEKMDKPPKFKSLQEGEQKSKEWIRKRNERLGRSG
ncbi:hypothetical protein BKA70DRAFT_1264834 [Coprinopsis sp. MPI-PUGE-AT-0042]|nr:hypothetical protein BKA70DRAFT_1264834 [Coprinopsis sp. MPI-PUGE-AT-0042]